MTLHLLGMTITDADVALTDWVLMCESLIFALLMLKSAHRNGIKITAGVLFLSLALSSFLGGIYHGFFDSSTASSGGWTVWIFTMLTIGFTACCLWMLAMAFEWGVSELVATILGAIFLLYAAHVTLIDHSFYIAIAFYLPAVFALLIVCISHGRRHGIFLTGAAGLVLTLIAAVLQQLRIGLHPEYFNHNALYHVIQFVALFLLFWMCRRMPARAM